MTISTAPPSASSLKRIVTGRAGKELWTGWTSVRKLKEGDVTANFFGFLTTEANNVVAAIHPKAMPAILTTEDEVEQWLSAPVENALRLQRPLPDDVLKIVARGEKEDGLLVGASGRA
jgi:putative SOS response-associated peptidase YedK